MGKALSFGIGAILAWVVTADHYGHIMRGGTIGGIMCRIHGLDTIRAGSFGETHYLCADLTYATPEKDLWDELHTAILDHWSVPR